MFDDLKTFLWKLFEDWLSSISHPRDFLLVVLQSSSSDKIVANGIEFYLGMVAVSFLLTTPIIFSVPTDKIRLMARGIFSLLTSAIVAMTWHVPFRLFGGQANFADTYLTYVYAWGPYLPLLALIALIFVAGLPPRLRALALTPAMKQADIVKAMSEPEASKGFLILGGILFLGVGLWLVVLQFTCLSYTHGISGWKLLGAVLVSILITGPVNKFLQRVLSIFDPPKLIHNKGDSS